MVSCEIIVHLFSAAVSLIPFTKKPQQLMEIVVSGLKSNLNFKPLANVHQTKFYIILHIFCVFKINALKIPAFQPSIFVK